MSVARAGSVAVAIALLASHAHASPTRVEGGRVVVHSTVSEKAVAERCRDALEAAIAVYERQLPYRLPERERLVLRLHAQRRSGSSPRGAVSSTPPSPRASTRSPAPGGSDRRARSRASAPPR